MSARRSGKSPLALGLDFGTESVRAILVETRTGRERGTAVVPFRHGVMERLFPPAGRKLPPDWALQHPRDYLEAMEQATRQALQAAGTGVVAGIGVDFTACTILPARAGGEPLCAEPHFKRNPHAYVKLWKHHGAQAQARRINELARARGEGFLKRYGAGVNCEWLLPKALQVLEEAPEVFAAAERFYEGGDWVVRVLTGSEVRNACAAGYKACWAPESGYPAADFLAALHPRLPELRTKLDGPVRPAGERAGGLDAAWAARLGLPEGTPVGTAIIDAHAAVPAGALTEPGDLAVILGTSFCHLLLGAPDARDEIGGISGAVRDGILPGLMAYEAGQAGGGDLWAWCVRACSSDELRAEARRKGGGLHQALAARAARYAPASTGLLALDWFNGNRSPYNRPELSGLLAGLTLSTPPEAIYRALQEALAFGTRAIVENFEAHGLPVNRIVASGGVAEKDPPFLQILADVTGRPIAVTRSPQACAVGAAILGAVAAGAERGGHASCAEAARAMGGTRPRVFRPAVEAGRAYSDLYAEYRRLAAHFGQGGTEVMAWLRERRA